MGMEDRDYYREDHAKRQGMRYNKKRARYQSDDTSWYDPKKYRRDRVSRAGPLPDLPGADWPWVYQLLVIVTLMLACFGLYKLVSDAKVRPLKPATSASSSYPEPDDVGVAPQKERQRDIQQRGAQRIEDQRVMDSRALRLANAEKREAEWMRYFQPSASCRENPATVDCANEYIRARRAFDRGRNAR